MRNIVALATNDLRLFVRDRGAFVWLIVMPLMFIVVMGKFGGDDNGAPANMQAPVILENNDEGFLGAMVVTEIRKTGLWVVSDKDRDRARFTLRIPADFTAMVHARKRTNVEIEPTGQGDESQRMAVNLKVARAVVAMNAYLIQNAIANGATNGPTEEQLRAVIAQPDAVTIAAKYAGRRPIPTGFNQSLPGMLVMYLFMNLLIFGGTRVAEERQLGVLRRITTHPVRPHELVLGKIGGLLLLSLIPTVVLLVLGQVAFGVNVVGQLPGILLALLLLSWVSASLGVLIGFVVKAHEKIIGLCLLVALPAAALGGCWFPIEFMPRWMHPICYAFPTAWSMDALHQFITFGAGIGAAAGALGVLAFFGLVANLAAMKFFRV